jgi:hypothetical protein
MQAPAKLDRVGLIPLKKAVSGQIGASFFTCKNCYLQFTGKKTVGQANPSF